MNYPNNLLKIGWILILALALTGCNMFAQTPAEPTPDTPDPDVVNPTDEAPIGDPDEVVEEPVNVSNVDLLVLESFPVQIVAIVSGDLRNGCASIGDETITRPNDSSFTIDLPEVLPINLVCTQALVPYSRRIALDVDGLPAGTYTVTVNGVQASFTLDMDNRLPDTDATAPLMVPIDEIEISISEGITPTYRVIVSGNLPDGCSEVIEPIQQVLGNTIYFDLYYSRDPSLMCTMALQPFRIALPIDVIGLTPGEYTVEVNELTAPFTLPDLGGLQDSTGLPVSCTESNEGEGVYLNPLLGYCFRYPNTFVIADVLIDENAQVLGIYGRPLDANPVEPVFVGLNIVNEGSAEGQTPAELAAAAVSAAGVGGTAQISEVTIGGDIAAVVEGLPGRTGSRQAFLVHEDTLYVFVLYPVDEAFPQAQADMDILWPTITNSFAFLSPAVAERFSACPAPTVTHTTYFSATEGFCLSYDRNFDVAAGLGEGNLTLIAGNNIGTPQQPIRAVLLLEVSPLAEGATLNSVVDAALADYADLDTLTRTTVSLSGRPAILADGLPGVNATRIIYVVANQRLYTLVLQPLENNDETLRSDLENLWETSITDIVLLP